MSPDSVDDESRTPRSSRREWLKRIAATSVLSAASVGLYAWQFEPHWVEVVERDLPITGLPSDLNGKTLVQISDIHIGDRVDELFLIDWFKRVGDWRPDFVVFTGDFLTLNENGSLPIKKMDRVLRHFPQGRQATIGILGNHDYGIRWSDRTAADQVERIATNSGIDMVRNESRDVAGLQIVGFDDYWSPNFGGDQVLRNVNLDRPTLVLCHNPDVADLPVWHGYRGWILSGHTHGGQCKAPFFAPPMLPVRNSNYFSGEVALADGRRLYINRALGHSMKVRFNVRPEITRFRLISADREELMG